MDKKIKFSLILILAAVSFFLLIWNSLKKTDYTYLSINCDHKIKKILSENTGITAPAAEKEKQLSAFKIKAVYIEKEYLVPEPNSLEKLKTAITNTCFEPLVIKTIQSKKTDKERVTSFDFYFQNLRLYHLILKQKIITKKPEKTQLKQPEDLTLSPQHEIKQIAIILDDWGYHNNLLDEIFKLNTPITFAILPHLTYSEKIAEKLIDTNYEFILHLPLEPFDAEKYPLEEKTILTTMPKEEVVEILNYHFQSLPNLKGINNHMGSKATGDAQLMRIILEQAKNHNLYFLDSLTNNNSIAEDIAQEKGVTFFKRDIFLDHVLEREQIKKKFEEVKNIAQETGQAIAIGHAKPLTVEILQEVIPELKVQGFSFVFLSELKTRGKIKKVKGEEDKKEENTEDSLLPSTLSPTL
ncbi:MAG: divergent polysaccharide deacetylase family protein [Candidatus Omnitrophota bacterium]